jgi:hypothetical protein
MTGPAISLRLWNENEQRNIVHHIRMDAMMPMNATIAFKIPGHTKHQ